MSTKASKIDPPNDPDPTPIGTQGSSPELQSAARNEKKRAAKSYGRQQTILSANPVKNNDNKILGG